MGKYIRMTKPYLVAVTVFVLLRFVLELVGVNENVTSEISLTRLLLVLPVFVGLRFSRETLGGLKEMVIIICLYVVWGIGLVIVLTLVDRTMQLGTHYGGGPLFPHLFWGHFLEFHAWSRLVRGRFCASILIMTVLANVACFATVKLSNLGKTRAGIKELH